MRTDVDACDCTQEAALKVDWEKSTLPYLGVEPASKLRLAFQNFFSFCINIQWDTRQYLHVFHVFRPTCNFKTLFDPFLLLLFCLDLKIEKRK